MGIQENPVLAKATTHECFDGTIATQMFCVSAAHLRAMQGAHAYDDVRNYLQGIYLDLEQDRDGINWLVATNGNVMARCPADLVDLVEINKFIAERKEAKGQDGKTKFHNPESLIFRLDKRLPVNALNMGLLGVDLRTRRVWEITDGVSRSKKRPNEWFIDAMEDGGYPPWRRVCAHNGNFKPAKESFPGYIGLNLDIIAKIHLGVCKIEPQEQTYTTMGKREIPIDGPVKITFSNDLRLTQVLVTLMPCRVG